MDWFKENILGISIDEPDPVISKEKRTHLENDYLKKLDYQDVDFYHLKGYECWAKVLRVVDGDTAYVAFFVHGKPFKYRVRLAGIDTAEKKSTDEAEKVWALKAENKFRDWVGNELVWLKCQKYDKYGRLLVEIYSDEGGHTFSLNESLKELGLAYTYKGRKRTPFREWAPEKAWKQVEEPEVAPKPVDQIGDARVEEATEIEKDDFKAEANAVAVLNQPNMLK
jgi:micrococcal nuclease